MRTSPSPRPLTLDTASGIKLGFPHDFLASDGVKDLVRGEIRTRIDGRVAKG